MSERTAARFETDIDALANFYSAELSEVEEKISECNELSTVSRSIGFLLALGAQQARELAGHWQEPTTPYPFHDRTQLLDLPYHAYFSLTLPKLVNAAENTVLDMDNAYQLALRHIWEFNFDGIIAGENELRRFTGIMLPLSELAAGFMMGKPIDRDNMPDISISAQHIERRVKDSVYDRFRTNSADEADAWMLAAAPEMSVHQEIFQVYVSRFDKKYFDNMQLYSQ